MNVCYDAPTRTDRINSENYTKMRIFHALNFLSSRSLSQTFPHDDNDGGDGSEW